FRSLSADYRLARCIARRRATILAHVRSSRWCIRNTMYTPYAAVFALLALRATAALAQGRTSPPADSSCAAPAHASEAHAAPSSQSKRSRIPWVTKRDLAAFGIAAATTVA